MNDNQEQRIREYAYEIWDNDGQSADREVEHWLEAERRWLRESNEKPRSSQEESHQDSDSETAHETLTNSTEGGLGESPGGSSQQTKELRRKAARMND